MVCPLSSVRTPPAAFFITPPSEAIAAPFTSWPASLTASPFFTSIAVYFPPRSTLKIYHALSGRSQDPYLPTNDPGSKSFRNHVNPLVNCEKCHRCAGVLGCSRCVAIEPRCRANLFRLRIFQASTWCVVDFVPVLLHCSNCGSDISTHLSSTRTW